MSKRSNIQGESPTITVWLRIDGTGVDPAACEQILGERLDDVQASSVQPTAGAVTCKLGVMDRTSYAIADPVEEVLDRVWPRRAIFTKWLRDNAYELTVECNVTIWDDRPLYELPSALLGRMAELGCDFLMDIFDYSGELGIDSH